MNEQDLIDARAKAEAVKTYAGLMYEIESRVMVLVEKLIEKDDEQVRGAIKEFRKLIELPASLEEQAGYIAAELTEQSASA